jgi:AmmeMemoRadiSam system protein B
MKLRLGSFLVYVLVMCASPAPLGAVDPAVKELLKNVGLKPTGKQRGQMDVVGFVTTAAQMDAVLSQCDTLAAPQRRDVRERYGWADDTPIVAGVCPHDDYYYAGRLYSLLVPHVRAHTVIVFGVFHKAKLFDCRDKLVFDAYGTWHGPYGPVKVSKLREEILERLPRDDYLVSNDMQMVEHSVEAIVPFLQAHERDIEIVSILVPYMDWTTLDRLAGHLSEALAVLVDKKGWQLGRDLCFISSSDAVHYGDSGWGGKNFADFGTNIDGYQMAVERDIDLAENYLSGPVDRADLEDFLYQCVDPEDVTAYDITWCGRFSIPFGLNVASRLVERLESRRLEGFLLDYGTSVSEASLNVERLEGLGPTAPNNLHHWVGYAALAFR